MCSNKNYQHKFDEKLKEQFFNTYKFSNHDNNRFILLLRKVVYPYEYMNDWEKFNEISLPEKEDFYSHLNMEDITDVDSVHAKKVCQDFETKNLKNIMICMFEAIHYCELMYLRTLEICALKYTNLILQISFSFCISLASSF